MSHWYEKAENGDVIPRHFVEMSSRPGTLRPTRITDVRKWWREGLEVKPSVTTILDVRGKPGLVNWKINQHLEEAYRLSHDADTLSQIDWMQLVKDETEKRMDIAPSAGTDLHKLMEDYLAAHRGNYSGNDWALAGIVSEQITHFTGEAMNGYRWKSEVHFVSPEGYGGCADLVRADWIIDYKTKLTAEKFKRGKMVYPEHSQQLAAYRHGLGTPNARCANVFVCLEDGSVEFVEHTEDALDLGWRRFKTALALWEIDNMEKAA